MRQVYVVMGAVLLGFSATSCGMLNKKDKDDSGSSAPTPSKVESAFEGRWNGSCESAEKAGTYSKDLLVINGNRLSFVNEGSAAMDCSSPEFKVELSYELTMTDATERAGLKRLQGKNPNMTATPLSENYATLLSIAGFCGRSDWKIGVSNAVNKSMENCITTDLQEEIESLGEVVGSELRIYTGDELDKPHEVYTK